jgi:hypothetical protein
LVPNATKGKLVSASLAPCEVRETSHSLEDRKIACNPISSGKSVMGRPAKRQPTAADATTSSMIERLERALVLAAYIVIRHGPVYAPYIDRLERELEAARQHDPTERAKRILEVYATEKSPHATRLELLRSPAKD